MNQDDQRGTWAFMGVAAVLLILYQVFWLAPHDRQRAEQQRAAAAAAAQQARTPTLAAAPAGSAVLVSRAQAIAQTPRVRIETPALTGSVSLKGGRIDDLYLKGYRETVDPKSPPVEIFRPEGAKQAYFADFGWTGAPGLPTAQTVWSKTSGDVLAPNKPVTFAYDNGQGLVFTRTLSVDDQYLFTVSDAVTNKGAAPVQLAPYASVQRQGAPPPTINAFEGAIGAWDGKEAARSFKDLKAKGPRDGDTTGGWVGLTDKYWLTAFLFAPAEKAHATYKMTAVGDVEVYETNFVGAPRTLAPGAQTSTTTRLFAGAKKASVLEGYQKALNLPRFVYAIDWGLLWFLTRPIFWLLTLFQGWVGSVGVAILMLTVVRVMLTFPLYNKSYASAAEMRKLAPEVEKIKEKYKDDAPGAQQATMALYKERKVNPLAGCVPALIPIPIFLALSKVFTVSLELRHAPFLFIHDLSAPDPTHFANLFGLLPFDPAHVAVIGGVLDGPLHIGVLAILYGFVSWLLQQMSPQQGIDPTQRQIFALMPIIFTFFMAHFAAGLLLYWTWSSFLSVIQQYVIQRRHKTENPIDTFLARLRGKAPPGVPAKSA